MNKVRHFTLSYLLFCLLSCLCGKSAFSETDFEILEVASFDQSAFTQGYEKVGERFFVSSGGYGHSFIASYDQNGKRLKKRRIAKHIFAEGLTEKDGILYLLSWKAGRLFTFDANTLQQLNSLSYSGQGWGLTHDGQHFLLSNGSNIIQFNNLSTFQTEKHISVTNGGKPLFKINELEYAQNALWANVWHDDHIYKIDPLTGKVLNKWDLAKLRRTLKLRNSEAVLNGIAFDESRNAFWITGKLWPKRFLIRFNEADSPGKDTQ